MARTAFAVVLLSVLVAGAFAGFFSNNNNNSDDQLQRQHQRQQQQQIQKCSCEQQRQFFQELKQVQQQCLQQCVSSENQPQIQWDSTNQQRQALQNLRQCSVNNQQYQRQIEQTIDCVDQKTQQQQSCSNNNNQQQDFDNNRRNSNNNQQQDSDNNRRNSNNNQQQIQNQDSSSKIADHWQRITNNVRQQMEEAYEQQQQSEQQKFGKVLTNQVYDCTAKCLVQKARQMDNAQRFGCEIQLETEQLKQTVAECHQKHIRRALENVVQCAASKGQQGANEFQQNLMQKNFNAEQLYKQY